MPARQPGNVALWGKMAENSLIKHKLSALWLQKAAVNLCRAYYLAYSSV